MLWDYDGTLVDTQPIWIEVEQELVARHGGTWTTGQAHAAIGLGGAEASTLLAEAIGDPALTPAAVEQLRAHGVAERVRAEGVTPRPGVAALMDRLADAGIRCALHTASPQHVVQPGLDRLPQTWFAAVVTGDQLTRDKPDPEGYLLAASRLGVAAADCLVIEDSDAGAESGRRAGAAVLAVPSVARLTPHPGQVIRPSLEGLDIAELGRIYREAFASR